MLRVNVWLELCWTHCFAIFVPHGCTMSWLRFSRMSLSFLTSVCSFSIVYYRIGFQKPFFPQHHKKTQVEGKFYLKRFLEQGTQDIFFFLCHRKLKKKFSTTIVAGLFLSLSLSLSLSFSSPISMLNSLVQDAWPTTWFPKYELL